MLLEGRRGTCKGFVYFFGVEGKGGKEGMVIDECVEWDAGLAQIRTAGASPDRTQQGQIEISPDGGSVTSSSSSRGENSASSSSVATIGPDSAQAGFSAQGGWQGAGLHLLWTCGGNGNFMFIVGKSFAGD